MIQVSKARGSRFAGVVLLLFGSLTIATTGPVLADTEKGHTGIVGTHSLPDSYASPGVRCDYDKESERLASFRVRSPIVFARNKTSSRDSRKVGWRFVIMRTAQNSTTQTTFYTSPIYKATAYDNQAAPFTAKTLNQMVANDGSIYKVLIKMFWFKRDGSKEGTALHSVDYYVERMPNSSDERLSACPTRFLH